MKAFLLALSLTIAGYAQSATFQLATPHTVDLNPPVEIFRCAAFTATTAPYKTIVTGFSSDGNYVLGQVLSNWVCGSSGRGGGGLHYYTSCTVVQWDLAGNLVSTSTPTKLNTYEQPVSIQCPTADVNAVFENAGGYTAETIVTQACGTEACYAIYYTPTLIEP